MLRASVPGGGRGRRRLLVRGQYHSGLPVNIGGGRGAEAGSPAQGCAGPGAALPGVGDYAFVAWVRKT